MFEFPLPGRVRKNYRKRAAANYLESQTKYELTFERLAYFVVNAKFIINKVIR